MMENEIDVHARLNAHENTKNPYKYDDDDIQQFLERANKKNTEFDKEFKNIQERGKDEFDTFRNYYETATKNGFLLELIKLCRHRLKAEPCPLNKNLITTEHVKGNLIQLKASKIGKQNDELLYAAKNVKRSYSEEKGNHLVADCKIFKYQNVISEKITVSSQYPTCRCSEKYHILYRCHHCCKLLSEFYVCDYCNLAMYCSKPCMLEAHNTYHKYLCYGFERHFWLVEDTMYLAMKMMMFGAKNKFNLEQEPVCKSTSRYNYSAIYNLSNHFDKIDVTELNWILRETTISIIYLIDRTYFFTQFGDEKPVYEWYMYVGGILFRHYLQSLINVVNVKYTNLLKDYGITQVANKAQAICPTISLLNHSCVPNCVLLTRDNRIIIKSVKDIQEGEELTICYSELNRHPALTAYYSNRIHHFYCRCSACTEYIIMKIYRFICKKCSGRAKLVVVDNKNIGECFDCNETFDGDYMAKNSKVHEDLMYIIRYNINSVREEEISAFFDKVLQGIKKTFHPDSLTFLQSTKYMSEILEEYDENFIDAMTYTFQFYKKFRFVQERSPTSVINEINDLENFIVTIINNSSNIDKLRMLFFNGTNPNFLVNQLRIHNMIQEWKREMLSIREKLELVLPRPNILEFDCVFISNCYDAYKIVKSLIADLYTD